MVGNWDDGTAQKVVADAVARLGQGRARVAVLRIERPGEPPRHLVLPLTQAAADARPLGRVVDAIAGPF